MTDFHYSAAALRVLALLDRADKPLSIPQLRKDDRLRQVAPSVTELKHSLRMLAQRNEIHTRDGGFVAGGFR